MSDQQPLYLHSACHTAAGVCVYITDGNIFVECRECHKDVVNFKVIHNIATKTLDTCQ